MNSSEQNEERPRPETTERLPDPDEAVEAHLAAAGDEDDEESEVEAHGSWGGFG